MKNLGAQSCGDSLALCDLTSGRTISLLHPREYLRGIRQIRPLQPLMDDDQANYRPQNTVDTDDIKMRCIRSFDGKVKLSFTKHNNRNS